MPVILFPVGVLLWPIFVLVFLPLVFLLVGALVGVGLVASRVLSIATRTVMARSLQARLEWRVRGALQSARAVREIAAVLERGDELPLFA